MFYDSLLLFALMWAVTAAEVGLRVWLSGEQSVRAAGHAAAGGLWLQLPLLAVVPLFFGGFWTRWGQTLGMQAWRLRVETEDGRLPGWGRSLLRLALACVSLALLGAGYWAALLDPAGRSWHDRLSRTRIVLLPPGDRSRR